jgi:hypothetical protein
MTMQAPFRAEKPLLTTHPAGGGDALVFPIAPSPPRWWWRSMRNHAGADPALIRPWDQAHEGRIAVICPGLDNVTEVIDAIDAAVRQTNQDYERELDRRRGASERLKTVEAERARYLSDVRHAIDERYPSRLPVPDGVHGNGDRPAPEAVAGVKDDLGALEDHLGLYQMVQLD